MNMQTLLRFTPRNLLEFSSIAAIARTIQISSRPSFRPSVCLQCRIRNQQRHFAEEIKRPISPEIPQSTSEAVLEKVEDIPQSSDLPSAQAYRRSQTTKRLSHVMDQLQSNIFLASQRINDLTGYTSIEALKSRIVRLEGLVTTSQEAVRTARNQYKQIVTSRSNTQREVTTLLARKDTWTPADLERFTSLYRNDHGNEQAVQEAAKDLADAEKEAERIAGLLGRAILERYHEEQIWSDKIRRMSTWGTWGLMGVNVLLFLVFQFGFEPWRRRRLVGGFEDKVREALERERGAEKIAPRAEGRVSEETGLERVSAAGVQEFEADIGKAEGNPNPAVIAVVPSLEEAIDNQQVEKTLNPSMELESGRLSSMERWKAEVQDLFSERLIAIRKQDVTVIALEGAAVGATLATVIATLVRRS